MEDNVKKVFEMIGIQPLEHFFFKHETETSAYYIDEKLFIKSSKTHNISDKYTIRDLLAHPSEIETKNAIKTKIETVFKFLVEIYNYNYLAKDLNEDLYAYIKKPYKEEWGYWVPNKGFKTKEITDDFIPSYLIDRISTLVSWEDDEPLDMRKPDMWQRLV